MSATGTHRLPWKRLVLAFVAAALLTGCLPKSTPPVAKLGLIAPFEGPSRPLGYAVLHAVQLRIDEWNQAGGVPRIELVALNDDGNPDLAARLPAQLAADPDILAVIGPPQGQTALAAVPELAGLGLPVLSLAPLPDSLPEGVVPFAGTATEMQGILEAHASVAVVAWQTPVTTTTIWAGDPMALAALRRSEPERVPAASSVAAEQAFAGWAGAAADGLIWTIAVPDGLPAGFAVAYEQAAGTAPEPIAGLAYAATDQVLALMGATATRRGILESLESVALPSLHLFARRGVDCCVPLVTTP